MLAIQRHEMARLYWSVYRAANGTSGGALWDEVLPALARLDRLCEDPELSPHSRGAMMPIIIGLRGREHAPREQVEESLQRLAAMLFAILDDSYSFRAPALPDALYLEVAKAAVRAFDTGPQYLNHWALVSDAARYARLDGEVVAAGIGRMVDEGLAEYDFERDEEAFRIVDEEATAARIDELEEARMLHASVSVKYNDPLRPDYKELIHGLARKHNVAADGAPTGTELMLSIADLGGDQEAFKSNVLAFAAALELVLSKPQAGVGAAPQTFQISGTFVNSPVQAGSAGATQSVQVTVDIAELRLLFDQAKQALAALSLDADTREVVDATLAQVDRQLAKPDPKPALIRPLLVTVAAALGAVGAAGEGIEYIQKLLALLGG